MYVHTEQCFHEQHLSWHMGALVPLYSHASIYMHMYIATYVRTYMYAHTRTLTMYVAWTRTIVGRTK